MRNLTLMGAFMLLTLVISCGKDDDKKSSMFLKINNEVINLEGMNLFLYEEEDLDMIADELSENTHTRYIVIATDAPNTDAAYAFRLEFNVYTPINGEKSGEYRLLDYEEGPFLSELGVNEKAIFTEFYINRGEEDDWYGWDEMEVDGDLTIEVSGEDEDIIRLMSSGSFERWRTVDGDFASFADELNLSYSLEFTATLIDAPIL